MFKCLIVEDDKYKAKDIKDVIKLHFEVDVTIKKSYKSGLKEILSTNYDFILLDMSMPTSDEELSEYKWTPKHFAGKELMIQMQYRRINAPVIIMTQFETFPDGLEEISLKNLVTTLEDLDFEGYVETIFYKMIGTKWQEQLIRSINSIIKKES